MYQLIQGDCIEVLKTLKAGSVQCCVTSPPYFGLRDYGTGTWEGGDAECDHKPASDNSKQAATSTLGGSKRNVGNALSGYRDLCGKCGARRIDNQIGLEETPEAYVAKLVDVFREVRRVLRDDGTLWLNLGDSYNGSGKGPTGHNGIGDQTQRMGFDSVATRVEGLKPKDLIGIPWMVAFALRADGWYLRSDIIWCLSGGTVVYARTKKGDMPMTIKDLARLDPATVQLWNGEKWTQLLGMSKSKRKGDELELVLRSGERIACTPTHKFPTQRGLLTAGELVAGDTLQRVRLPEPEQTKDGVHISLGAAWLAGLYIAEGSRAGDTIQIAGHASQVKRLAYVQEIAQSYGGSVTYKIDGNNMSIRIYGKVLNAIIDELVSGKTAKDKGFAPVVWRYGDVFISNMMMGYLDGDGHYDEANGRWRLGFTRNYNLERDLRTACARLGWHLVLNMAHSTMGDRLFPSFRGEIRMERSGHHNERNTGEIVEIRKARSRNVYDLGVADDPHVFALASGILTHNSKPNPMPESVTDRPTKAHEYIFLLSKAASYYYDADAVREPNTDPNRTAFTRGQKLDASRNDADANSRFALMTANGRNRRSVWTVTTKPYSGAHFATFPPDLIEPCILAGTSAHGCCAECGAPWVRVVERAAATPGQQPGYNRDCGARNDGDRAGGWVDMKSETVGWEPTCACNADVVPCTVLDPFNGSGATGAVSLKHGRHYIGLELNPDYIELAHSRITQAQPMLAGIL